MHFESKSSTLNSAVRNVLIISLFVLTAPSCLAQNNGAFRPTTTPIRSDGNVPQFPAQDPNKRSSFPQVPVGQPASPAQGSTPAQSGSANNPGSVNTQRRY